LLPSSNKPGFADEEGDTTSLTSPRDLRLSSSSSGGGPSQLPIIRKHPISNTNKQATTKSTPFSTSILVNSKFLDLSPRTAEVVNEIRRNRVMLGDVDMGEKMSCIDFVVGEGSGVCILSTNDINDMSKVRNITRDLIKASLAFDIIWLVIDMKDSLSSAVSSSIKKVENEGLEGPKIRSRKPTTTSGNSEVINQHDLPSDACADALAQLARSVWHFPCSVLIRYAWTTANIVDLVLEATGDALASSLKLDASIDVVERANLVNECSSSQDDLSFLATLPSLNFYSAMVILNALDGNLSSLFKMTFIDLDQLIPVTVDRVRLKELFDFIHLQPFSPEVSSANLFDTNGVEATSSLILYEEENELQEDKQFMGTMGRTRSNNDNDGPQNRLEMDSSGYDDDVAGGGEEFNNLMHFEEQQMLAQQSDNPLYSSFGGVHHADHYPGQRYEEQQEPINSHNILHQQQQQQQWSPPSQQQDESFVNCFQVPSPGAYGRSSNTHQGYQDEVEHHQNPVYFQPNSYTHFSDDSYGAEYHQNGNHQQQASICNSFPPVRTSHHHQENEQSNDYDNDWPSHHYSAFNNSPHLFDESYIVACGVTNGSSARVQHTTTQKKKKADYEEELKLPTTTQNRGRREKLGFQFDKHQRGGQTKLVWGPRGGSTRR
jgi:hypothetical protein